MATSPEFQTGNRVLLASDEIADEFIFLYGDNYWPFDFDNLEQKFFEGGGRSDSNLRKYRLLQFVKHLFG